MTNDDYANNPIGSLSQSMTFRGNVIYEGSQANDSQILALYNDEASGSPVSFPHHDALQHARRGRRARGVRAPLERRRHR